MKLSLRNVSNTSPTEFFLIFLSIVLLDQITKNLWVQVCNSGFAFGFGFGGSNVFIFVVVLIMLLATWIVKSSGRLGLGYVLILAGGFSNLLDRVNFGCVRDFITIGVWPSFNLADAVITVGVFVLLLAFFRTKKDEY